MTTELHSCNPLPPVVSVCGLPGHARASASPGRPRGSVEWSEGIGVACMDRRERTVPSIEEHSFIEENLILPIPPPPLVYQFDVEDSHPPSNRRTSSVRPPDEWPEDDSSIISCKSVVLFFIAFSIVGFIVLSPLLHCFLWFFIDKRPATFNLSPK